MEKKNILIIGVIVCAAILLVRLFVLQIIEEKYKITAINNAYKYETVYPARGIILDRKNRMMVGNKTTYDINITPIEITEFDTLDFCNIFSLKIEDLRKKLKEYKRNRRSIGYQSLALLKQVSDSVYNIFAEKSYKFPWCNGVPRTARFYPFNAGANIFGYIAEVDTAYLRRHPEYKRGDYVGKSGLELSYEEILRGEKGYTIYLRDVHNRVHSNFAAGAYDKLAVSGKNLFSTIDGELQQYGELLMQNKVGSLVAIEPSTGEILAIISSPGIDITRLSNIGSHYSQIANDPYKPMFNRAVMSSYPPGSVFKLVNGLIGLQDGVITPYTKYPCSMGYYVGNLRVGCHSHTSPIDFTQSIMMSCNAYYCYVFRRILDNPKYESVHKAFDHWREMVMSFGFGKRLGTDFPAELGGNIPTRETYDRLHGKNRWRSLSVISLAIGQGEIGVTPLHIANLGATIANRGYYYTPHLIKGSPDTTLVNDYGQRHYTLVDTLYFSDVIEGMYRAVNSKPGSGGTARIAAVPGLDICGKTGTAQNPHGKDHSVFLCFAPRNNPKIAVAAYIENGGFGATYAAPIASLLVEKYLTDSTSRPELEKAMIESNLLGNVPIKSNRR